MTRTGAIVVVLLGVGCQPEEAPAVRIGALLSTSGYVAGIGSDMLRAADLAVDDVNAAGGLLGRPVTIVNQNDDTDEDNARAAAQALIDDGIPAFVGGAGSAFTLAAASVATPAGVVMVSPYSTTPTITNYPDNGFLFRTVPSDALAGALMAQRAKKSGHTRAAVIYAPGAYGLGMATRFAEEFQENGDGVVTDNVEYPEGQSSYVDLLTTVLANDPDMIALPAYPIDAAVLVSDYLANFATTEDVTFYFGDGLATEEFVNGVGVGNFGFPHEGLVPHAEGTQYGTFAASFEATHGFRPYAYLACAYDASLLIQLAIEAGGSDDPISIRDQLPLVSAGDGERIIGPNDVQGALDAVRAGEAVNYQGASGDVDLDEFGDVIGPYDIWEVNPAGAIAVTLSAVYPEP